MYPTGFDPDLSPPRVDRPVRRAARRPRASAIRCLVALRGDPEKVRDASRYRKNSILCRSYGAADAHIDELLVLADEKIVHSRKAEGMNLKGSLLASSGKSRDAIQMLTAGIAAWRSTGSTVWLPLLLSYLVKAYADIGQFVDALHTIADAQTAVETTKESWCEAEILRVAGEIALGLPKPDVARAETSFERALGVARKQQAKSFELRAAMSLVAALA